MKRLLLALSVVLAIASPASAALALVGSPHTSAFTTPGTTITTPSATYTTGNLIVVTVQFQDTSGANGVSVADPTNGAYTPTTHSQFIDSPVPNRQYIAYFKNATGFTGQITATCSGGGCAYSTITSYEVSGADTSAPFVTDGTSSASSGTTISSGTLTVTGSSFFVCVFESDDAGDNALTPTPFSGYTQANLDGAKYIWGSYHIAASSEACGATTVNTGKKYGIIGAAFKAASGASPTCVPTLSMLGVSSCGDVDPR